MPADPRPHCFLSIPYVEHVSPELVPSIVAATVGNCRIEAWQGGGEEFGKIRIEQLPDSDGARPLQSVVTACKIDLCMKSASLHGMCFNMLWCEAEFQREDKGIDYFAMHHSDIGAQAGWLDALVTIQKRTGVDIVSAVVPIKDFDGLTSTAFAPKNQPGRIRRLTMHELYDQDVKYPLPPTFGINDIERRFGLPLDSHYLYLNTGLWVCDFRRDWITAFPGFNVATWIVRDKGKPARAAGFPEDWAFSKWAQEVTKEKPTALKVMATREVSLSHYGRTAYHNNHAWGRFKTDQGSEENRERARQEGTADLVEGI